MTQYKYGTLLEVQNDDPHPDNDVEKGDLHIKAGKHEDGDQYEVMTEEQVAAIKLEPIAIYESDQRLSKRKMHKFVRDQAIEDPDVEV
jgi:hypothetical protein